MDETTGPLPPYARAVCYPSAAAARRSYQAVHEFIFQHEEVELSVYHLLLAQVPHVVVLGEPPGDIVNDQLTGMLAAGAPTHLPPGLIQRLAARRDEQDGPWSARQHGRAGEPLP